MDKSGLYYQTPYIKLFMYTVEHCREGRKGAWLMILNRTGFYPEGGGQPYDTRTLNEIPVLLVHERGEQVIHELVQPIEEGTLAEGITDWQRRYDNIQLHTGGHILSGLIHRHFGYDNVGFHMGTERATVNFSDVIEPEKLERLEDEANQLVYASIPVKVPYPTEEELRTMEYRSRKELSGLVRIVEVSGGDVCACYGTHVENTGGVGTIKIRSMIYYKGGVHLSMLCDRGALLDYRDGLKDEIGVSNLLSARLIQVPGTVGKPKNNYQDRNFLIEKLGSNLMILKAGQFPESADPLTILEEGLTPVQIHQYTALLYEESRAGVAIVRSGNDRNGECHYALGSSRVDMYALNRALSSRLSGRGGGSNLMVQRTFRAGREAIEAVFQEEAE